MFTEQPSFPLRGNDGDGHAPEATSLLSAAYTHSTVRASMRASPAQVPPPTLFSCVKAATPRSLKFQSIGMRSTPENVVTTMLGEFD